MEHKMEHTRKKSSANTKRFLWNCTMEDYKKLKLMAVEEDASASQILSDSFKMYRDAKKEKKEEEKSTQ